jgi:inner membrane protein
MASIGHITVGMAFGRAFSRDDALAKKAAVAFSLVSLWPDSDVIGFLFGVHYSDPFGHRGATHSLVVAAVVGLASCVVALRWRLAVARTAVFTTLVAASHAILDTLTHGGGLGCALLWPFSNERFWAPVRFIPIAPIGLGLLSIRGVYVMLVEFVIFSPLLIYTFWERRPRA